MTRTYPSLTGDGTLPNHQIHWTIRKSLRLCHKTLINKIKSNPNPQTYQQIYPPIWNTITNKQKDERRRGLGDEHGDDSFAMLFVPRWDGHEQFHQTCFTDSDRARSPDLRLELCGSEKALQALEVCNWLYYGEEDERLTYEQSTFSPLWFIPSPNNTTPNTSIKDKLESVYFTCVNKKKGFEICLNLIMILILWAI